MKPSPIAVLLLGAATLAAATGMAFAAWAENGGAMLFALVESGLAWCF